jgi:hypothetical protein
MKANIIAFAGIALLALFVVGFASIFEIRLAFAQVNATSSPPSATDFTTTPALDLGASTSTDLSAAEASSTSMDTATNAASDATNTAGASPSTEAASSAAASSTTPVNPPPVGLNEVHIIGMKYTDYFTDGTTVTSYPGDPAIDAHFSDVPDGPIPTRAGLTWVHTTGQYIYDTPSGELEVGEYALEAGGTYVRNEPPSTWVSSTSTPAQIATSTTNSALTDTSSTTSNVPPTSVPDASTTVPAPSNGSASTTNSESTTSPSL